MRETAVTRGFNRPMCYREAVPLPLRPHPRGDVALLGSDCIRIDRGGGELGMPEPALQEVQRDAGLDGRHPKPMP